MAAGSSPARYQSFRSLLLAGTLGVVITLSCLMLALSIAQSTVEMSSIASAELAQVALRTEDRVRQLLRAAEMTAESAVRQAADRALATEEYVPFFTRMVAAFEQRPELTYLGYASAANGECALLERRVDGSISLRIYLGDADQPRVAEDYGWTGSRFERLPDGERHYYDPRVRPFFVKAQEAGKAVWTSIYRFVRREVTDSAFGITYAIPVFDGQGRLAAVWDADFDLRALTEFTRTLHDETGALAAVVAEVDGARSVITDPDLAPAIRPGVSTDWALRAIDAPELSTGRPFAVRSGLRQGELMALARSLGGKGGENPEWTVLAAVPRARMEAPLRRRRWIFAAAAVVVSVLGGGAAVWTAGRLSRPLVELRDAVERFGHDEDPGPIVGAGRIAEVVSLAQAFDRMAAAVKARQRELMVSRQRLRSHLDQTPIGVIEWDEQMRVVYCNPAAAAMCGRPATSIVGGRVNTLVAEQELGEWLSSVLRLGETGGSIRLFHCLNRAGDRPAECEWYITATEEDGKSTGGATAMLLDVSERLVIEEAFRAAETRFHVIFQGSPVPMLITRLADSRIVDLNACAEREFGYPRSTVVGRTTVALNLWLDTAERSVALAGATDGSANQSHVVHVRTSRGEARSLLVSASRLRLSGEDCLLWAAVDITERERMEESLHASRALRAAAFDAAHNPMITFDASGRIVEFNAAAERAFDRAREDILGRDLIETVAQPDQSQDFVEFIKSLLEKEKAPVDPVVREYALTMRDGRGIECEISTARTEANGATLWTAAFRDVTATRAAARQIAEANQELERRVAARTADLSAANARLRELDRLKSEFLATMSHELRTPLNSILGFTELVRSGRAGNINTEQAKQLGLVHQSARHLLDLINDLLDLSRIEAGRLDLVREKVDVVEVVHAVAAVLAPVVTARGLTLSLEPAESATSLEIMSDRKRVFQVVLNLANNAVKFTPHGSIAIVAKRLDHGAVGIAVRDTGIGINAEQLPLLFEAFRRLEGSARRVVEGSGLGLYLVSKLLTLLGGAIDVESEPGKGSCFTVRLPADNPGSAACNRTVTAREGTR